MQLKHYIQFLTTLLLSFLPLRGQTTEGVSVDTIRVSLITCWPGAEVYELAGHEAIRIQTPRQDMIWNYGVFDFNEPNFIGRFVAGQTDYKCVSYPFAWFMPEYVARGSRVEEQVLRMPGADKERLLAALRENALPKNATYRYNYVLDNCATRITDMVDSASSQRIIYPDTIRYGSFRREMRSYHRDYPWYQFGIDLVLGSGLDRPISRKEEMFVPIEMHRAFASARYADGGGPVVEETIVLNEGRADASLPATPWYQTPTAVAAVMLILTLGTLLIWIRKKRFWRLWFSLYFAACGLAGIVVTYLVFFSSHEATSPNLLLIWLNPLQFIPAIGVWFRCWRWPSLIVSGLDGIALSLLLIAWPMQRQAGSAAIWMMIACGAILGILYTIICASESYYNNIGNRSLRPVSGSLKRAGKRYARDMGSRAASTARAKGKGQRKR